MKTVAIIGTTASGKSDAAHEIARKTGAVLLSCDSLAVYKEVDITSAKPIKLEREDLKYFGLDIVDASKNFSVNDFIDEYKKAEKYCLENSKDLIIVGGSSFYLKTLIDGLSDMPKITQKVANQISSDLNNISSAYSKIKTRDPHFAATLNPNDKYRIEKALVILYASDLTPTEWFITHPKKPFIKSANIYEIIYPKDIIDNRIRSRVNKMIKNGLIDEASYLETRYKRSSQIFRSIGLKECLDYFDGKLDLMELAEAISTHTVQFAKRQRTFNGGQFEDLIRSDAKSIIDQAQLFLTQSYID